MKKLMIFFISLCLMASCTVIQKAQAPRYDLIADSLSNLAVNQTHNMYERMKTSDASFPLWSNSYDSIGNNIDMLIKFDSSRKNSAAILKVTWDWRNRLNTFRNEHEGYNRINQSQILIYQDWMDNLGNKIYQTEKYYK